METTIVYPAAGRTLYGPGGVHGFSGDAVGVPLPADHAQAFIDAGHVVTAEQKKAAEDMAKAEVETVQADSPRSRKQPQAEQPSQS